MVDLVRTRFHKHPPYTLLDKRCCCFPKSIQFSPTVNVSRVHLVSRLIVWHRTRILFQKWRFIFIASYCFPNTTYCFHFVIYRQCHFMILETRHHNDQHGEIDGVGEKQYDTAFLYCKISHIFEIQQNYSPRCDIIQCNCLNMLAIRTRYIELLMLALT